MNWKAQLLTIFLTTLLLSGMAFAQTTYYVDSIAGNDANNGTSASTPWQTLANVSNINTAFPPGTTVLFKRGGLWRGEIAAHHSGTSTAPITYSAYGRGAMPLFLGSVDASGASAWTLVSGNIWQSVQTFAPQAGYTNGYPANQANDVGNVIFLTAPTAAGGTATGTGYEVFDAATMSVNGTTDADLTSQGRWRFNTTTWRVELYSTSNPGSYYPGIELAVDDVQFIAGTHPYIQVSDLEFRYSAGGAFFFVNSTYDTVTDCRMSWEGGGNLEGKGVRYGNGVEIYLNANNFLIERNWIYQTYDGGIVVEQGATVHDITLRNNIVWLAADTLVETDVLNSVGIASNIYNIDVYNNTFVGSKSWAEDQRPNGDQNYGIWFPHGGGTTPIASNIVFENNAFVDINKYSIVANTFEQWSGSMTMDYDLWSLLDDGTASLFAATQNDEGIEDLSTWAASYPAEQNGFIDVNPQFVDQTRGDFTPAAGSPLRGAGINLYSAGVTVDFNGNPRPLSGAFTIGAIQCGHGERCEQCELGEHGGHGERGCF